VGRKGQCWDNAVAESFFSSLKGELIDTRAWSARAAACRAVVEYIAWYNGTGCTARWATAAPLTSKTTVTESSEM
jgi:transposase InsO family protein